MQSSSSAILTMISGSQPLSASSAGSSGAFRTIPSRIAVYGLGFGSSSSQSPISRATLLRSAPSASALVSGGSLLGVVGQLVKQVEQIVGDGLMGGLGRGLEHLHDGVGGQDLRSVEHELAALRLVGSGLEQAAQGVGVECLDQAGDPLTQLVLDDALTA